MEFENEFDRVILCLPKNVENIFSRIDRSIKEQTFEMKIRVGRPVVFYGKYGSFFVDVNGKCTSRPEKKSVIISKTDMKSIIGKISEYSIHSKQSEIVNGYITYGKNRIGLCGNAVYSEFGISNVVDFSSLTLRIARNITDCADEIMERFFKNEIKSYIIAGPPCSGKTTVLRDIAVKLSTSYVLKYPKVTVIDERLEFADADNLNMGLCDVLKGYTKFDGIVNSVRTLSPDVIICDEITTVRECEKIAQIQNNGVAFVCSIHTGSIKELQNKEIVRLLLKYGSFKGCILLDTGANIGKIADYYEWGD